MRARVFARTSLKALEQGRRLRANRRRKLGRARHRLDPRPVRARRREVSEGPVERLLEEDVRFAVVRGRRRRVVQARNCRERDVGAARALVRDVARNGRVRNRAVAGRVVHKDRDRDDAVRRVRGQVLADRPAEDVELDVLLRDAAVQQRVGAALEQRKDVDTGEEWAELGVAQRPRELERLQALLVQVLLVERLQLRVRVGLAGERRDVEERGGPARERASAPQFKALVAEPGTSRTCRSGDTESTSRQPACHRKPQRRPA